MPIDEPLPRAAADAAQVAGFTDMDVTNFRAAAHLVVELMADYLETVESRPVLPTLEPGALRTAFPSAPPEAPEPIGAILDDYRRLIEPNATHWQHPSFFAYFPTTASAIGILGEMLTAAIGQNAMLWRTSPPGTELEQVVVDWLRQAFGLPEAFDGLLTDTASTSTLIGLAAAREAGLGADLRGGRAYASSEAHSSVEKALLTLGLGRDGLVRIAANERFEMRPEALEAAIAEDRSAGLRPFAVVATIGTTSSTSIDPVPAIATIAEREGIWLHVDAAYGGALAIVPEHRRLFAGWERADSIVVNPHKWLFTPLDASILLSRRLDAVREAFSLTPPADLVGREAGAGRDYTAFTPQLGRRFRALKVWMLLRWFGLEGLRRRLDRHVELARAFVAEVDADPAWQRLAPVPFATVCFRYAPGGRSEAELDELNGRLLDAVNGGGEVFLSHTRLADRFTLRLVVGNLRTERRHVERAWAVLRGEAAKLDARVPRRR